MTRRVSVLAEHHLALGAGLDDWNGMDVAWSYASDPCDEHDAVRDAAGLFDVSGLKKVWVKGNDALAVLDHVITRDMTKIPEGKSAYGPTLTEEGTICDDAIIYNMGGGDYLFVHGTGKAMARLEESAAGKDVSITADNDLHDLSLQGPKAVEFLNQHTPFDLPSLPYFHHVKTTVFGNDCIISRTGYSGERGYEMFANAKEAVDIWEKCLEHGRSIGIVPCSFGCLDKVRIEAALLFYPYDINEDRTPWEVGLGWTISKNGDYRGKDACFAKKGQETVAFAGIVADHSEALPENSKLFANGVEVGIVNGPGWSHRLQKSIALTHLTPEAAQPGTRLEVKGDGVETTATVAETPFYDPQKLRPHA